MNYETNPELHTVLHGESCGCLDALDPHPYEMDADEGAPVARCGRSADHGAHAYLETNGPRNGHRRWCAGNRAIVEARTE